jgi:copper transport protein
LGRPVSDERNSGSDKSSANSGEAEVLPGEAKVLRGEVEGLAVEGGSQDVVLLHQVSSLASIGLPALVVSGLVGTILHVDSVAAAGSTLYGRLLIAKVALAVAMAIVGFINQRQLAAAHIAGLNWLRQMQRRIGIELVMGLIVVGLTGVLVASTPARDAYRPVLVAEYTQGELKTELRITPARVGLNDIRIRFLASDGSRRDVNAVTIRVSSSTVPERKVPLTIVNGSEVRATGVSFGVPGTWKILISTLSETGSDSASFEVDL